MNVKSKDRPRTLSDLIKENLDTSGLSDIEIDEVVSAASEALKRITPRGFTILKARIEEGKTQVELGRNYFVTPQRIRTIYNNAERILLERAADYIMSIRGDNTSLYSLGVSPRLYNLLRHNNIHTVEMLEGVDINDLYEKFGIDRDEMCELKTAYRRWYKDNRGDMPVNVPITFKKAVFLGL